MRLFYALLLLIVSMTIPALAERRVALVIGNNSYAHAPKLNNPINDASDVSAALVKLGFEVISVKDTDLAAMQLAIRKFARAARGADASLFYYSGHGMQWEGENMLVPVDATFSDADIMPFEVLPLRDVMNALSLAGGAKILILDACRDNEAENKLKLSLAEKRGTKNAAINRGFSQIKAARGQVVVFATQPDRTAVDRFGGSSRNSPFTHAFLEAINSPGEEIGRTFRKVAARVDELTEGRQLPEISISLLGDFYLVPGEGPEIGPSISSGSVAADFELAERINTETGWEAFLARHGDEADNFHVIMAREALKKLALVIPTPEPAPRDEISGSREIQGDAAFSGRTVDEIISRGQLLCGVLIRAGFAEADSLGDWQGFDVDICRAIAAGIVGNSQKVNFVPVTAKTRYLSLMSGEVDILARSYMPHATESENLKGVVKVPVVTFRDGLAFIINKDLGVDSALQLSGAMVCILPGTSSELAVANYFQANSMEYEAVALESFDEAFRAYASRRCDVLAADRSRLHESKMKMKDPDAHIVLPESLDKSNYGPFVRSQDNGFEFAISSIVNSLIKAEEAGITSERIASAPELYPVSNSEQTKKWSRDVIGQVGNYAEIFNRNLGKDSALGMERGMNALWNQGGLLASR